LELEIAMAGFKRRHVRNVLLEWSAYGLVFGAIALVGACQAPPDEQSNGAGLEASAENVAEVVDGEPNADAIAIDPEPGSPTPLSEPEFSEAIRADYRPLDLSSRSVEQLSGSDPEAVTAALFSAQEPVEGRYSESSDAELGNERAVVLFVRDNLADDSVQAILSRVEFERVDGPWQVVWAGEQYRCREGRGQQDWAAALCN